jgi:hypothetical protein
MYMFLLPSTATPLGEFNPLTTVVGTQLPLPVGDASTTLPPVVPTPEPETAT